VCADVRRPRKEFIAYCADYGEDRFELRALGPRLRLEIQYALQCRVDAERALGQPRAIKPLLNYLAEVGDVSLLDRSPAQWLDRLPAGVTSTGHDPRGLRLRRTGVLDCGRRQRRLPPRLDCRGSGSLTRSRTRR
jgi:hypothetical protein